MQVYNQTVFSNQVTNVYQPPIVINTQHGFPVTGYPNQVPISNPGEDTPYVDMGVN